MDAAQRTGVAVNHVPLHRFDIGRPGGAKDLHQIATCVGNPADGGQQYARRQVMRIDHGTQSTVCRFVTNLVQNPEFPA